MGDLVMSDLVIIKKALMIFVLKFFLFIAAWVIGIYIYGKIFHRDRKDRY